MRADWLLRFWIMAISGIGLFFFMMITGSYGFAAMFLGIGVLGCVLLYYVNKHR